MQKKLLQDGTESTIQLSRISNLLALLATKDMGEGEKIATLSSAGFSNSEIGRLFGKRENTVGVALFKHRKRTGKK